MDIIQVPLSLFLLILIIVNAFSLILFGIDKLRSRRGEWRISESSLMFAALFGPFGAFAGMLLFRHKTRKAKFLLVPIFLLSQLGLMWYFHLM